MTQGSCPSCGAPVEFTAGSALVVVCSHCQTVVARKGLDLEAYGKIGAIVDTDSPLRLGLEGRFERVGYKLVGHLQKDHGAGPWDEWYVEFEDGRTGWLSESEGAFHLLFEAGDEEGLRLEHLIPGKRFSLRHHRLVVEERGHGKVVAAEGQFPRDLDPSADGHYVDATGPKGVFATLDFGTRSERPEVFIGRKLKLEELGIPPDMLRPRVRKVGLQQARCTECNGPLELRAPDRTRRVACPYCGALLDTSRGRLAFLQLLEKPEQPPKIPLGARGTLEGTEWICIGFLVRSCTVEGVRYPWEEYLLFNRQRGFTWLMESNGHWTFLTPLEAGEVSLSAGNAAYLNGTRYRAFQRVLATTERVLGEFYWEVQAGEQAQAEEYVAPPCSVNVDRTENEVTFTLGRYLEPQVVKEAFGLKEALPEPRGVAPSQPNPHSSRSAWRWAGLWVMLLIAVQGVTCERAAEQKVLIQTVTVAPTAQSGAPSAMTFSEPFELKKRGNMEVRFSCPSLSNDWLGIQGDLVNDETGEVTSFYQELSHYSGYEGNEWWAEDKTRATMYLSALPPGRYVLRSTAEFDGSRQPKVPRQCEVVLTHDVPHVSWLCCALLLLLAGPLWAGMRASSFEATRWMESNLS